MNEKEGVNKKKENRKNNRKTAKTQTKSLNKYKPSFRIKYSFQKYITLFERLI